MWKFQLQGEGLSLNWWEGVIACCEQGVPVIEVQRDGLQPLQWVKLEPEALSVRPGGWLAAEVQPHCRADSRCVELEILLRSELLTSGSERGPGETPLPRNISHNWDSVTPKPTSHFPIESSHSPTTYHHYHHLMSENTRTGRTSNINGGHRVGRVWGRFWTPACLTLEALLFPSHSPIHHTWNSPHLQAQSWHGDWTSREGLAPAGQRVLSHTPALEVSWTLSEERLGLVLVDTTVESLGLRGRRELSDTPKQTHPVLSALHALMQCLLLPALPLSELPHRCPHALSPLCFVTNKQGLMTAYHGHERISGVTCAEVHAVGGLALHREPYLQASPQFPLSTCCAFHSSFKAQCKCLSSLLAESVSLISVLLEAW